MTAVVNRYNKPPEYLMLSTAKGGRYPILEGTNYYKPACLKLRKVASPQAKWAPPPGKMLFIGNGFKPVEDHFVSNQHFCATVKAEKVFLKPCVWLDKTLYWEQLPDGKIKNLVSGKCIARSTTTEKGHYHKNVVGTADCSSPSTGKLARMESNPKNLEGSFCVLFEWVDQELGKLYGCMQETRQSTAQKFPKDRDRAAISGFRELRFALENRWGGGFHFS
eukprot:gnl/TRDRNA2_/TRDRNA2_177330_c7_seq13.p1 gnl/TRDRNA2_/TRDRNA2_177330_c7~~gnl/TRDRNA2_/TRDRNA2_177330_c7_seq13.p1  ORF type:complete len:228 (-),score=24.17 gnl/TRDRNA2_/TRDRNA2_177330_c7_seq13:208-870(-)